MSLIVLILVIFAGFIFALLLDNKSEKALASLKTSRENFENLVHELNGKKKENINKITLEDYRLTVFFSADEVKLSEHNIYPELSRSSSIKKWISPVKSNYAIGKAEERYSGNKDKGLIRSRLPSFNDKPFDMCLH